MNRVIRGVAVAVTVAVGVYVVGQNFHFGKVEFTENAQIKQLVVPVNNRVQGYIRKIGFQEFQTVQQGDTLLWIEDEQYVLALNEAEVGYQQALTRKLEAEIALHAAQNEIALAESKLRQAEFECGNATVMFERYGALLKKEAVTQEQFDNVRTAYQVKQAQYKACEDERKNAILRKKQQEQQLEQVEAEIKLAAYRKGLARLNLSYTVVTAPCDGVIGRKNIQQGQLVQSGQTLVTIVDGNDKWVTANFRESQIAHIAEGQAVEIQVDAFPDWKLTGRVSSLADATGSAFSIVPQDNSTGNFVKVEQRIPVRIEFDEDIRKSEAFRKLRAGMNVECLVKY